MSSLDLFPLRTVLVPGASLRLHVFEERYKEMIGACIERGEPFGVVLDRNGNEVGDNLDPAGVGTTAQIVEVTRLPQGQMHIVARGIRRFRVDRFVRAKPFWTAEVQYLEESTGPRDAALRLRATAVERFRDYVHALLRVSGGELDELALPDDPGASSFLIADALNVGAPEKQRLLESPTAAARLIAELKMLDQEIRRLRAAHAGENTDGDVEGRRGTLTVRISLN